MSAISSLISIFLAINLTCVAHASDIETKVVSLNSLPDINIIYHGDKRNLAKYVFLINESNSRVNTVVNQNGIKLENCVSELNILEIYEISFQDLNSRARTGDFGKENQEKTIAGVYSRTPMDNPVASIYIASDIYGKDSALIHEISHYWYDKLCLFKWSIGDTEKFAQTIEKMKDE